MFVSHGFSEQFSLLSVSNQQCLGFVLFYKSCFQQKQLLSALFFLSQIWRSNKKKFTKVHYFDTWMIHCQFIFFFCCFEQLIDCCFNLVIVYIFRKFSVLLIQNYQSKSASICDFALVTNCYLHLFSFVFQCFCS